MSQHHSFLRAARYRLDFAVTTPLQLPAYAGSTLRGAWGAVLRRSACITRAPRCDGCALISTCPYAVLFETRPPAGKPLLQDFSQVPRPYVIEPPQPQEHPRAYAPGETLSFHLVLIERAIEQLPLAVWACERAFQRGVGKDGGTAELVDVCYENGLPVSVWDAEEQAIIPHEAALPLPEPLGSAVILVFETPLRLQTNGRRVQWPELTARKLLMTLVRRVALLAEFHGTGPLAVDFAALAHAAETIESEHELRWQEWQRYSSRQDRKIPLGGAIGRWTLRGEALSRFVPFLHLGQWVHVGKEATFGLGKYKLVAG